jgi:hypothetical protein
LSERPDASVRVFVIWEPVLASDLAPPTSSTLARLHDARAAQYWDAGRALSEDIVRSMRADPKRYAFEDAIESDRIVWDVVALFPRGAFWEKDIPVPTYYGAPVVESVDGLRKALDEPAGGRAPY